MRMAGSIKGLGSFLGTRPDYAAQGAQSVQDAAREFASVTEGNALVTNAGLKAQADIASAQHYADAAAAGAQAQSQASMVGGIASGLGGLAGFMPKGGLFGGDTSAGETFLKQTQKPWTIV
jgi:hypothetical protein